jgi:hypothetical protein
MEAPSAVGFTVKERLLMLWQHKKPFVLCFIAIIGIGLLVIILFAVVEVHIVY